MTTITLAALKGSFAVSRLPAEAPIPAWATGGPLVSITRTGAELSIVCLQEKVPSAVESEPDWRCLEVAGRLEFSLVGILASLVTPLAREGIPVFAISTFTTDYLLVKAKDFESAVEILRSAGHKMVV
jgi:hypothetical protein